MVDNETHDDRRVRFSDDIDIRMISPPTSSTTSPFSSPSGAPPRPSGSEDNLSLAPFQEELIQRQEEYEENLRLLQRKQELLEEASYLFHSLLADLLEGRV